MLVVIFFPCFYINVSAIFFSVYFSRVFISMCLLFSFQYVFPMLLYQCVCYFLFSIFIEIFVHHSWSRREIAGSRIG